MSRVSIGVDIVSINRIESIIKSDIGNRFIARIFTDLEIKYCEEKANPFQHYAGRFAAKESIKKALLSRGITHSWFKNIEIQSRSDGAPDVHLLTPFSSEYQCECSISHTGNNAIAFALIQKK